MILRSTAISPLQSAASSSRMRMRSPSSFPPSACSRWAMSCGPSAGSSSGISAIVSGAGALTFSVTAMAIPTFLIGLLPGYATLGLAAPIALTLLRMVQGLAVGGEYTSSMVFLVEHAPDGRRGVMGALAASGGAAGILLGSAVGAGFAASMSDAALDAWGWRIPFLLGLAVGVAGYLLRRHVMETVPAERRKRAPIMETLSNHWRIVLGFAGLSAFNAVGFYVGFVSLLSWLQPMASRLRARLRSIP